MQNILVIECTGSVVCCECNVPPNCDCLWCTYQAVACNILFVFATRGQHVSSCYRILMSFLLTSYLFYTRPRLYCTLHKSLTYELGNLGRHFATDKELLFPTFIRRTYIIIMYLCTCIEWYTLVQGVCRYRSDVILWCWRAYLRCHGDWMVASRVFLVNVIL